MINRITKEKLEKYFSVTQQALDKVKFAFDEKRQSQAEDFFDMASRYFQDAQFFSKKTHDYVTAFAALNYAHGWLDAGARIGLFKVNDSQLFTVDDN